MKNGREKEKPVHILAVILMFISLCLLGGCQKKETAQFQILDDFAHATIGVQTGTTHEARARELFPDAVIKNYTTVSDLVLSLQQGKIDGFIKNDFFVPIAQRDMDWIDCIPESMEDISNGIVSAKCSCFGLYRKQGLLQDRSSPGNAAVYAALPGRNRFSLKIYSHCRLHRSRRPDENESDIIRSNTYEASSR